MPYPPPYLVSCEENDQVSINQQQDGKGSMSATILDDGWMQSSALMGDPGMLLWLLGCVVIRKDGSCCVDTAEDDDGLDGIDEWRFTATDDARALDSMHAASLLQSWMKDDYDDNNQGYNDTIIPIVSM
ncbi:predicted protein [Lichtheimia corymbifera JMRC:FSU:9682]|uniref:Uncharacterized protein n=1 Tax=Lichtheimia corymbifera JMRC:FSU:9682 TaxID=1263082 RepID=A0A068RXV7_9FUNG|nr:predicted protein [Lichtheimia corymbifera JMRC:FSU:9682]